MVRLLVRLERDWRILMKVKFNEKVYIKSNQSGAALKHLCFDIFKQYLDRNQNLNYREIQNIFNQWHCNNNAVVLSREDWEEKTENLKGRYFDQYSYNGEDLFFTTQWGNNGADCDNINNMIQFAKDEGYDIEVLEGGKINHGVTTQALDNIKNIILYGAPGVGKTYSHKKLIALIEGGDFKEREIFDFIVNNKDDEIEEGSVERLFQRVKSEKRMKFITFHQSFGYEDFIEGFRPNEEGNIGLEKGIFLEICKEAEENLLKSSEERKVTFKEAFNRVFKEKIENEESVRIDLKRTGSYFKVNDFNDKTIYFEKQSGTTKHTLSMTSLEKMYDAEKNDFINGGLAVYYEPILEKLLEIKRESSIEKIERKNYYLVIDEINRGNISKIFGELITLIEEDKRDILEVTLPYSKKLFRIPSNLYIIGTMNSTDKSIALIDIALRRRFTFLKMKPNETLITHPKAKEIFKRLNKRIAQDLGEDYMIGHSYFMKVQIEDHLDFILEYKIIPLLEEYYYGDDDRLIEVVKLCEDNMVMDDNE